MKMHLELVSSQEIELFCGCLPLQKSGAQRRFLFEVVNLLSGHELIANNAFTSSFVLFLL